MPGDPRDSSAPWWGARSGVEATCRGCLHPHLPDAEWSADQAPKISSLRSGMLHSSLFHEAAVTLDSPLLSNEGRKASRVRAGSSLYMQRLSDLKGMHLREISSGFPLAFKEEQSFSETLYCTLERQGVQRLRSLGPEEVPPRQCYANLAS